LRQSITEGIPEGEKRDEVLSRVAILDCAAKADNLASCDPLAASPNVVDQWKKKIEVASIDRSSYSKALAAIIGDLVCRDGIYVLGDQLFEEDVGGPELAAMLATRITSTECPVWNTLTDTDKRKIGSFLDSWSH
jgi:hypothetical protein